jgi:hypothetical protein
MAVVTRGWPATDVIPALLAVAADRESRPPGRVAEAGPWWGQPAADGAAAADAAELAAAEARLADLGGRPGAVQAQARAELTAERMPVTRATVTQRAIAILDRGEVSA